MPVAYTAEQIQAIETRGRDLLVSAAAGSGKTAVLTERILRHITVGENGRKPLDIDQLLVVTFTEAAAAEMRERIAEKIADKLKADPGNAHLKRQEARLSSARISTVHAFCRALLKEYFQQADLDPSFKVGNETELALIKTQVMEDLLEDRYAEEDNEAFVDLAEAFGGGTRDDRLDALIRKISEFIENEPYPEKAARNYAALFAQGSGALDETPWADVVRDELAVGLEGALECVHAAQRLCMLPEGPVKYLAALDADEALITQLIQTLDKPLEEMYAAFTKPVFARLYGYRNADDVSPVLKDRVKSMRSNDIRDRIKKLSEDCFFTEPEKMRADIAALSGRVTALMELVMDFRNRYAEEKRARNLLDFNDLEHYVIRILTAEDTEISAAGADGESAPVSALETLRRKFREVLIDEYQDSNAVQELIFTSVAGDNPRFMVGDVKQSIYRFRRANPGLFIDKYKHYAPLSGEPLPAGPVRIDLSQNFRSRKQVIDTVNFFFSQLMTTEIGEVDYDDRAALYYGANYPDPPAGYPADTCVELIDGADDMDAEEMESTEPATSQSAINHSATNPSSVNQSDDSEKPSGGFSKIEAEAYVIAQRIHEAVGKRPIWDASLSGYRPCKPGDIVILTRSLSGVAADFTESLKKYGVDAVADLRTGFLDTLEIQTALAFLRVIDNPRQDIDLITVLFSPVYAFTPDELIAVRETNPDAQFYDCVKIFAETAHEKSLRFLSDLTRWREMAAYLPISRLIGAVYDDTRYPAYAGSLPGGVIRQANLRLLLERAVAYEETGLTGLFHFMQYIERLRLTDAGGALNAAQPGAEAENRVRIMTVHRSKGLEFPVVFVSLLGREMNREDERRNVVLHQEYGLGPVYVDLEVRTQSNTLAKLGLSKMIKRDSLSEELRVLYVAMTRAKEWLVLTGYAADLETKRMRWAEAADRADIHLSEYYRREAKTYLDWLLPCLLRHRDGASLNNGEMRLINAALFDHPAHFSIRMHNLHALADAASGITTAGPGRIRNGSTVGPDLPQIGLPATETPNSPVGTEPCVLTPGPYPFESTLGLPSKVSISELKRLYALETTPESTPLPLNENERPLYEPPAFIKQTQGITAARMGTALHTVVEKLDLHTHTTRTEIDRLICDLVARNLLTAEEAEAIDRKKIERFARSPLAERMRAASVLYREVPFVMSLPPQALLAQHAPAQEGSVVQDNTAVQHEAGYLTATLNQDEAAVLVHGIIDCYFEENGQWILVDYKNDAVFGDPRQWAKRHRIQVDIYKQAVTRATGKAVSEALLYSFALGDTVRVDDACND